MMSGEETVYTPKAKPLRWGNAAIKKLQEMREAEAQKRSATDEAELEKVSAPLAEAHGAEDVAEVAADCEHSTTPPRSPTPTPLIESEGVGGRGSQSPVDPDPLKFSENPAVNQFIFDSEKLTPEEEASAKRLAVIETLAGHRPTKIVLRGDNYELAFLPFENGRQVRRLAVLSAESLLTQRRARAEVARATNLKLKVMTAPDWELVTDAVMEEAALNVIHTATEEEDTRSWVLRDSMRWLDRDALEEDDQQYRISFYKGTRSGAGLCGIREGDSVRVHLPTLLRSLHADGMKSLTLRHLAERLGRLGFKGFGKEVGFRARETNTPHKVKAGDLVKASLCVAHVRVLDPPSGTVNSDADTAEQGIK